MLEKSKSDQAPHGAGITLRKRQKFVTLAENRTRNAMKAIRTIAKLGNKNAYDYTDADVKKIAAALMKEVDALRARMTTTDGKEIVEFEL